ncbi:MAG: COX15/CtaA family protein [Verrucomicrobiota bacterium]
MNPAPPSRPGAALRWHAVLTVAATLVLISIGGLVTSKGVGMAVPDWPTTYGYNMFFFPLDQWTGGIFHEHLHRLVASTVGLLTLVLAVGLQASVGGRSLRRLGWLALALVLTQGLLGGLRVVLNQQVVFTTTLGTVFGLTHATLAQVFLCTLGWLAFRAWLPAGSAALPASAAGLRPWVAAAVGLLLVQLLVAATMRHQHAGLAVPDFPLAHGRLYPPTDPEFLAGYHARRTGYLEPEPVTAFHVHLHMTHRFLAVALLAGVLALAFRLHQLGGGAAWLGRTWGGLVILQFLLGVLTVLTNKAADLATAHVAVGASLLLNGVLTLALLSRPSVASLRSPLARQAAPAGSGDGLAADLALRGGVR